MLARDIATSFKIKPMVLLFLCCLGSAHAQTASRMDRALASRELSVAQAAYFTLAAAELIPPDTATEAAFSRALANKWLENTPDSPVTLGELSYLIMQAFKLKGNLLYVLFPGPRYAYRELVYRQLVPPPGDPAGKVTGREFFRILGNTLALTDEGAIEIE